MGDGPGAHFQREYADASYHERIPYIGLAVKESKIQYAPYANTSPYYKWTTYDINIMGDVATSVWLEEPFTPNVNYVSQIPVGTNFQFNVTVTKTVSHSAISVAASIVIQNFWDSGSLTVAELPH